MICEECALAGERSTVEVGASTSTAVYTAPFFDEEGRRHDHDWNERTTEYRCSRGHTWKIVCLRRALCCDWPPMPERKVFGAKKEPRS